MPPRSTLATLLILLAITLLTPGPAWAKGEGKRLKEMVEEARSALSHARFQEGERRARDAVQFARDNFGAEAPKLGGPLSVLGKALHLQGRYQEAEAVLREAVANRERFRADTDKSAGSLRLLGNTLAARGRYAEAVEVLDRSLTIMEQGGRGDIPTAARTRNAIAELYLRLGRYAEAQAAAQQALKDVRDYFVGRSHPFAVKSLRHLATAALRQRDYPEAERLADLGLKEALAVRGEGHPESASFLVQQAIALSAQGRSEEGEALARRAVAVMEGTLGPDHPGTAKALAHWGRILARLGHATEARAKIERAIIIDRAAHTPWELLEHTRELGKLLAAQGETRAALASYREAMEALEALHAATRGLEEGMREGFVNGYRSLYEEAMELLLKLHDQEPGAGHDREALAIASRTQSRLFSELLRLADVEQFAGDAPFLAAQKERTRLQEHIAQLRREAVETAPATDEAENGTTPPRSDGERLRQEEQQLARLEKGLWRDYPRFMELQHPRPVTVERLQKKLLHADEALITWFLMPARSVLFVVTPDAFQLHVSPLPATSLAEESARLRAINARLVASGDPTVLRDLDPERLFHLYRCLVMPAEALLKGKRRIFAVGDGPLHTLPLELLVSGWDGTRFKQARAAADGRDRPLLEEYATLEYLGGRYRFAYLPSLSTLESLRLHPRPAVATALTFAAFADPLYPGEAGEAPLRSRAALHLMARALGEEQVTLPPLPETGAEAKAVAAILGGSSHLYLRGDAQEASAKSTRATDAEYLLFATHGLLGGDYLALSGGGQPPQPALALTMRGDLGGEDGLLTMGEVMGTMRLNTRLVALSACNTAGENEEALGGEGFAGLTRAFLYAGTHGLLVSHWSVESGATRDLMTALFTTLKGGAAPEEALQRAREEVMHSGVRLGKLKLSRAHPYFWAPFVYVGE